MKTFKHKQGTGLLILTAWLLQLVSCSSLSYAFLHTSKFITSLLLHMAVIWAVVPWQGLHWKSCFLSSILCCHSQLLFCNPSVPNNVPASLYVSLTWFPSSWILGKFIILKRHACGAQKKNCKHSLHLCLKHCFQSAESWFLSCKTNSIFNMENF